jgi:glutathione S-transferase
MLKVHGVHGSPFVRKVLIVLEMKGIPYEIVTPNAVHPVMQSTRRLTRLEKYQRLWMVR